jgi:hypothetical protein
MKTRATRNRRRQLQLRIQAYGNFYYIERIAKLESVLKHKPRSLHIDIVGFGEIPADLALLMRSVLLTRSPGTRIITNARSSLRNGSVLVWLCGDRRLIRDDAKIFFRRANLSGDCEVEPNENWKASEPKYRDSCSEVEPEEGDHARVLQIINEFLPVDELAGRLIGVPVLRQFGLVQNEEVDNFLATVFGKSKNQIMIH